MLPEIRNKLQSPKTVLEKIQDGVVPSKELVEVALRDLGEIEGMLDGGVLPDVLKPGLRLVFCGMAAGHVSAKAGQYYAKTGNQFWSTLFEVGITKEKLCPHEFKKLLDYGIGLTDLAKHHSGMDHEVALGVDVEGFCKKIKKYKPKIVALVGKRVGERFFGKSIDRCGLIENGDPVVWVLPSTSGAARRYWDIRPWWKLAEALKKVDHR